MQNEKGAEKKARYHLESTHTVHTLEPDYHRPLLEIPAHARERMLGRLETLYGEESAKAYIPELERILRVYYAHRPDRLIQREKSYVPEERFTQEDMILITYGDLIRDAETSTLKTLIQVIDEEASAINTVHILPFFPSSSDRGFSIIDFETVDPHLGTWEDIEELDDRMHLMFDGGIQPHLVKEPVVPGVPERESLLQEVFRLFQLPERTHQRAEEQNHPAPDPRYPHAFSVY